MVISLEAEPVAFVVVAILVVVCWWNSIGVVALTWGKGRVVGSWE